MFLCFSTRAFSLLFSPLPFQQSNKTPQKLKPEPDSPPPPPLSSIQIVASIPKNCCRRRDAREAGKYVCMQHIQQRKDRSGASSRRQARKERASPLSPVPTPPPSTRGTLASTTAAYRLGQRHGLQRGLHSQVVTAHTCGKGPQASLRSPFINRKFFVYKNVH